MEPVNFKSIRLRLPLLFTLISAVPALVAIYWISGVLNTRLEQMLQQRVQENALMVENVFNQYGEDLLLKVRLATQTPRLQELLSSQDRIALINQLSTLHQDLNLSLYGAGIEIYDQTGRLRAAEPKRPTQQVPDTMIYTALKKGEHKVSRYFEGEHLRVSAAMPVFNTRQAGAVGVVAISFDVSHKLADEIRKLMGSEVLIFTHPLGEAPEVLGTTLDEQTSAERVLDYVNNQQQLSQRPAYLLAAVKREARNGQYYLAAAIETRDMLGVIRALQQLLLVVAGAAALLALIAALLLSRRLVRRIVYLVQAARLVEQGELDTPIQLRSADELGGLADNLDAMRREIKRTLQQQELMITHLTVRDQINSAIVRLSGNELLKEVLMLIIEAIAAQKGSIMMMEEATQTLTLKVVYDPVQAEVPINIVDHISFTVGEGIAGMVAATGEAMICNDTRSDRRFKTYRFQEMDGRINNIVCLPLKVDGKVLGVISLDNKIGGFTDEDLTLVQGLANQVAIAIQNAELYERSITDGLTGLFIRRYFEDLLDQELKRSQRSGKPTALMMFDIDHFKRFNDTYGHQVGDWVIQQVARVARESIRDGLDMAARYGGEEFAIIMPETDLSGAMQVAERVRQAVEASFVYHEGHRLTMTISLGCAVFPEQAETKETLIQHADTALYESKHQGRNRSTPYSGRLAVYEDS
ncbi:MAG: diguanylate cyclase [Candidatus Sericytochromatia bacterium]